MNALFTVEKPAGCLSGWQISRYALDGLAGAELHAADHHLATCARCADLVHSERADVAAAALEPLPQALRHLTLAEATPRRRSGWQRWWLPLAGALTAAAVALLVVVPSGPTLDAPGTRLKGAGELRVDVLRDAQLVVEDGALAAVGPLRDGDQLRLRAPAAAGRFGVLEGLEDGRWQRYFADTGPAGGVLPTGIAVSADDATRLRWAVCGEKIALPSADAGCVIQELDLEVRP